MAKLFFSYTGVDINIVVKYSNALKRLGHEILLEKIVQQHTDDWQKMVHVLQEIKQNSAEMDEAASITSAGSTTSTSSANLNSSVSATNLLQQMTPQMMASGVNMQSIKSEPMLNPSSPSQSFMSQLKQTTTSPK